MTAYTMLDAGGVTGLLWPYFGCSPEKKTWLQALSLLYINRFGLYAKYRDYAAGKLGAIPIQ